MNTSCHKVNLKWLVELLVIAAILLLIIVLSSKYGHLLNTNQLRELVKSFGVLSPIIYIVLTAATNVVPPLAATPLWVLGALLFGFPWAYVYMFAANLLGAITNYSLARIFGRPVVKLLAGEKALVTVDRYVGVTDLRVVLLIRLVGGAATDYISYAAGLSSMRFGPYVFTTLVGTAPILLLGFLFTHKALSQQLLAGAGYFGVYFLITYLTAALMVPIFAYLSKHRAKK